MFEWRPLAPDVSYGASTVVVCYTLIECGCSFFARRHPFLCSSALKSDFGSVKLRYGTSNTSSCIPQQIN